MSKREELLQKLSQVHDELKEEGLNIVSCVSEYASDGAHFHTRVSIQDQPQASCQEDHVLLDTLRELLVTWSNAHHKHQLSWPE